MLKKFLKNNTIIGIMLWTLGYRILGFFREFLIASKYGASINTDAYIISQTFPDMLLEVLAFGSISSLLVSVIDFEKKNLENLLSEIIGNFLLISFILYIFFYLLNSKIISVLIPGFSQKDKRMIFEFSRLSLILFPLSIMSGVFGGYIMGIKKGIYINKGNFLYNLVFLLIGILISKEVGIKGFIYASILAASIRLIYLKKIYVKNFNKFKLRFNLSNEKFIRILKLMVPIIFSSIVLQLNFISDKMVASKLEVGSISYLAYSNKLIQLPLGIIIGSAVIDYFPKIVKKLNGKEGNIVIIELLKKIIIIMSPLMVYIYCTSEIIVSVIYNKTKYTNDIRITADLLKILSCLLIINSIFILFQKTLEGIQKTKIIAAVSIVVVIINICGNIVLSNIIGIYGIAWATNISSFVGVIILYFINKNIYSLNIPKKVIGIEIIESSLIFISIEKILNKYLKEIIKLNIFYKCFILLGIFIIIFFIKFVSFSKYKNIKEE